MKLPETIFPVFSFDRSKVFGIGFDEIYSVLI